MIRKCKRKACNKDFEVTESKKEFCGLPCFRLWRANYRWSATADARAFAQVNGKVRVDGENHDEEFNWSVEEDHKYYAKLRREAMELRASPNWS